MDGNAKIALDRNTYCPHVCMKRNEYKTHTPVLLKYEGFAVAVFHGDLREPVWRPLLLPGVLLCFLLLASPSASLLLRLLPRLLRAPPVLLVLLVPAFLVLPVAGDLGVQLHGKLPAQTLAGSVHKAPARVFS